jgi:hypothetical protein
MVGWDLCDELAVLLGGIWPVLVAGVQNYFFTADLSNFLFF